MIGHKQIHPSAIGDAIAPAYYSVGSQQECSVTLKSHYGDMSLSKVVRSLIKPARGLLASSEPNLKRSYAAVAEAKAVLEHELDSIRAAGTWKAERIITSKQGPQINVEGSRDSEFWLVT
ncbi:hypothetical protein ILYODFUR_026150 [Ilyodon furcidens]|uniref:Uncharacterized protein n=1 Tax=Ilyodon furcidens TaxID=33524 RepID=A0ABV0SPC6_9TELE